MSGRWSGRVGDGPHARTAEVPADRRIDPDRSTRSSAASAHDMLNRTKFQELRLSLHAIPPSSLRSERNGYLGAERLAEVEHCWQFGTSAPQNVLVSDEHLEAGR